MAVYRYPPEVHEAVKELCTRMRDAELAEEVNRRCGTSFTAQSMKSFRGNHHYNNGMSCGLTKEEYMAKRYPPGMFEYIRDNSWNVPSADLARQVNEKFGTSFSASWMKAFRQRHGIKSGLNGWFQRGRAPGNKGKKQEDFVKDPEKLARIRSTQFKKGHYPVNHLPVGTVRVTNYGYKVIKIQEEGGQWDRWRFLHRYTWEQAHGPIPKDMIVTFKDSNPLNCELDNLILITKQENAWLNRKELRCEDPDLTETAILTARLSKKLLDKKSINTEA